MRVIELSPVTKLVFHLLCKVSIISTGLEFLLFVLDVVFTLAVNLFGAGFFAMRCAHEVYKNGCARLRYVLSGDKKCKRNPINTL